MTKKGGNFLDEARLAFRQLQEEVTGLQEEYSRQRLEAWRREMRGLMEAWEGFQREWQGTLELMAGQAAHTFAEVTTQGLTAAGSWRRAGGIP